MLLMEVNPYVPASLPISLGYLASVLGREGHRVKLLNIGESTELSVAGLQSLLAEFKPGLVGMAAYQRNMLLLKGLCRLIKETEPGTRIILGGPQATFMPSEALKELPDVDFICRAEGEMVITEVTSALESGCLEKPVRGTTTRLASDHWEDGEEMEPPEDLDKYPSPFLDQVLDLQELEEAILLTSRGCPYGCVFCYTPRACKRRIRYHSVERVLEEMTWLNGKGIRRFWMADPSFSFQRERTQEILEGILRRGIHASLWLETRADLVDKELLALMAKAGVRVVAYGLESASQRVLELLGKSISLETLGRAVNMSRSHGLDVELFSQYGLPGETQQDAIMTLEFVRSLVPIRGNTNAQQMRLYFGAALTDDPESYGIRPLDRERPAYISVGARYETKWMSAEQIHQVRDLWQAASLDGGKRMVS
ncbi:MAG: radical SAM protein [bacterium]